DLSVNKVSAAEPFVGRSSGSGLRGRNLPHEQREKGRDEEGQHDRSGYVGEGEHRGLSIGKVPSNALLQALVWNRAGGTPLLTAVPNEIAPATGHDHDS